MLGALINAAAVVIGGGIGLICKKGVPEKYSEAIMTSIALCVMCVGLLGVFKGENILVLILAMVFGTAIGVWLDLDRLINRLGEWLGKLFTKQGNAGMIAQGFVAASLFMGIGAMSVVGSLEAGLTGNIDTLVTKSLIDFITSIMLAVSLGVGVLFSSAFIFACEGSVALLAQALAPVLNDVLIAEMSCAGSLLLIALALNMLKLTKIKVANLLPAILLAPLFSAALTALNIG